MAQAEVAREQFYAALLDDDPRELYDKAPCGYLSTTPEGRIVKANRTFLTWTGYSAQQLLSLSLTDLLTPGGRLYHETHYAPMLRLQGSAREIALDLVRADGSRLPVLLNATLDEEQDRPAVVRVAIFDATERREYERELLRAKRRAEDSERRARELALTLQQALLPPSLPDIPGLRVAAAFRPAAEGVEIGGDFYDVFSVGEDDWVVVIGDVCGKGVEAALVTSLVRHTLRAVVVGLREPSHALAALNQVLLGHQTDRFCTAALIRLRRTGAEWTATVSAGGHPQPLLFHAPGEVEPTGARGPLLGIIEQAVFEDWPVRLRPGESLVLYTDGVTEARDGTGLYGDQRLLARVADGDGDPETTVARVLDDAVAFAHGAPQDDIAVVAVQVSPA